MAEEPEFHEAVLEIKDKLLGTMKVHEAICPGSKEDPRCWEERVNVLAFLAHALGMKPAQVIKAAKQVAKLNEEHDAGKHGDEEFGSK